MNDKQSNLILILSDTPENIYDVIGTAMLMLASYGRLGDAREMRERVEQSDDYEKALDIIGEYVVLQNRK